MSRFASGDLAVAICDRCLKRYPYKQLRADGNENSLRVCSQCWDPLDRFKLPPRMTEAVALQFPRPDKPLVADGTVYVTADHVDVLVTPIDENLLGPG